MTETLSLNQKAIPTDAEMYSIEENWGTATPEQKLSWYNGLAARSCPPMKHWRGILELANHFSAANPTPDSDALIKKLIKASDPFRDSENAGMIHISRVLDVVREHEGAHRWPSEAVKQQIANNVLRATESPGKRKTVREMCVDACVAAGLDPKVWLRSEEEMEAMRQEIKRTSESPVRCPVSQDELDAGDRLLAAMQGSEIPVFTNTTTVTVKRPPRDEAVQTIAYGEIRDTEMGELYSEVAQDSATSLSGPRAVETRPLPRTGQPDDLTQLRKDIHADCWDWLRTTDYVGSFDSRVDKLVDRIMLYVKGHRALERESDEEVGHFLHMIAYQDFSDYGWKTLHTADEWKGLVDQMRLRAELLLTDYFPNHHQARRG